MKADFSRDTFDPLKHFSRVLMQQGRVQLDADWNEQAAILLHYLRTLATDLLGPHWGPVDEAGFVIAAVTSNNTLTDLEISEGRYYVDGILCENEANTGADGNPTAVRYSSQPNYPLDSPDLPDPPFLVYLDVWERLITYVEDDTIREVALDGPDTAARAKVVCQVKTINETADGQDIPSALPGDVDDWRIWVDSQWSDWLNQWQPENQGRLKARTKDSGATSEGACITPPGARYRGAEDQLYRVEIHQGGKAGDALAPTFKWSRDNGAVVFPIRRLSGNVVTLESFGRDDRFSLQEGNWVEVMDDNYSLRGQAGPLVKVQSLDRVEMTVTLASSPNLTYDETSKTHPLLRRWDGVDNIQEGGTGAWLSLEDEIQIQFQQLGPGVAEKHTYRNGDYWLIPARTATGNVEWPGEVGNPDSVPPHGVKHHYAPLAIISDEAPEMVKHCRRIFKPPFV